MILKNIKLLNIKIFSRFLTARHITHGAKVTETRKVTEADVANFSNLTGDFNSVHFGENGVVHGVLLNGFVSAVLGMKLPGPGYVVVEQSMTFPNPFRAGDDLEITVEVVDARKIIMCKYECKSVTTNVVVHQGFAKMFKIKSPT